jgi:5-methylthioadenosine/S-adenosylhomocysteine deaminase
MEPILLKNCKIILDAFNKIRSDLDILINNKVIEEIGHNLSKKGIDIDCSNCLVVPGFFNGHTHSPMSLLRGIAEDLPLHEWLNNKVWPLERKFKEEHYYIGAKLSIAEMLKYGFTGAADMYFNMDIVAKSYIELNFRGVLCEGVFDFFNENETEKQYKKARDYYFRLKNLRNDLIKPSLGPHATYTCSEKLLRLIADLSSELNALVQIHVAEDNREQELCIKNYGIREVNFLSKIGLCNERTIYAHSVWLNEEEISLLKNFRASIVHNPISNLKLGVGSICNIKKLLDNGIKVCLGTDGPASNNSLDPFETMKISSLLQKHFYHDPAIISSKEIFKLATYGGYNIYLPELNAGIIKEGSIADLAIFDLRNIRFMPLSLKDENQILAHLVYSSSGMKAKHVIVNGKLSVEDYKLTNIDEEKLFEDFERAYNSLFENDF